MGLTVLGSIDQVLCRMSHYWDFSDVFLMMTLGLCVLGEEDQRCSAILSHRRKVPAVNMTYHCWCRPWSPGPGGVCCARSHTALSEGSLQAQPTLTGWGVMLHLRGIDPELGSASLGLSWLLSDVGQVPSGAGLEYYIADKKMMPHPILSSPSAPTH